MMRDDIRIEIASDPRLLCTLRSLVRSFVGVRGFPPERADEVVLAVDEACTNSIRHSYDGKKDQSITLVFRTERDGVELILSDTGVPAQRERLAPRELIPPDPASVKPGGLGVQIMYRVFDEVIFEPGEVVGNRVTMRLKRPPAQDAAVQAARGESDAIAD